MQIQHWLTSTCAILNRHRVYVYRQNVNIYNRQNPFSVFPDMDLFFFKPVRLLGTWGTLSVTFWLLQSVTRWVDSASCARSKITSAEARYIYSVTYFITRALFVTYLLFKTKKWNLTTVISWKSRQFPSFWVQKQGVLNLSRSHYVLEEVLNFWFSCNK